MYEIGSRIRMFREVKRITQKELAGRIGVSGARVSNWEQGLNRPDVGFLARICEALNVSPSELLDFRLPPDELNDLERTVIAQYRKKTEMQKAVNILLEIEPDKTEPTAGQMRHRAVGL